MEVIGANHGVRPLDQPFSSSTGTLTAAPVPRHAEVRRWDGHRPRRGAGAAVPQVRRSRDARRDPGQRADALLVAGVRVPIGPPAAEDHRRELDDRLVRRRTTTSTSCILTRHPIPQALSCIRNGWTLQRAAVPPQRTIRPASSRRRARSQYSHEVLETGSQARTLRAAIGRSRTSCPMRLLADRPQWTYLSYEQCVLEPADTVQRHRGRAGAHRCRCDATQARERVALDHAFPRTRRSSASRPAIGSISSVAGADKSDPTRNDSAMAILERFGVDLYRCGDDVPDAACPIRTHPRCGDMTMNGQRARGTAARLRHRRCDEERDEQLARVPRSRCPTCA